MAFYDDKRRLLKQIRHSFVTGDESQLCEHVLLNNDFPLPKDDFDSDDDLVIDDEHATAVFAESPDGFTGSGPPRPRTYTAIRLERMKIKRDKEDAVKTRHVSWGVVKRDKLISDADLEDMFSKKNVPPLQKRRSKLTELLNAAPVCPPNPFAQYARYDGAHCIADVSVKNMKIFFALGEKRGTNPIQLSVISSAKVSDVIGLVCWHYVNQNRTPMLSHTHVASYSLLFAEEDGEYDFDFPCLDRFETISKFHFTSLALVSTPGKVEPAYRAHEATQTEVFRVVILPARDVVDVFVPKSQAQETTVSDLMQLTVDQCFSEQTANRLRSKNHVMKDKGDPENSILSLSKKLTDCFSRDFVLAPSETRAEEIRMRKHLSVMEASLYESFIVSLVQKIGTAEIHLGISGEKIEVNPVTKSSGILPSVIPVKPVTYHIDSIADCSIVDEKYGKKSVVRLVYKSLSGNFKHLDIECDIETARKIDQKCKHILNFRSSFTRQEYQETEPGSKRGTKK
ncbi:unnamed protein product [Notodromas monacha]|uniref:Stress-activated map kinase-interacting protein 1 n=1 Tax=Notodromas monacha TaxID=399045 RepID=A0A7R9GG73_9CRUS|nr:unnamed protein product [Notodromas monacha]CAG0920079.1 unnamed protein product [Notodromas monacha]